MKIQLDDSHEQLVQAAVARGKAADPVAYLQALIDRDASVDWIGENQQAVEDVLRERLQQPARERPDDWRERIRDEAKRRAQDVA